ncbi:MAG: sporulation protein YqfD [Thermoanaerobacteraceae bacterium]|nr:sporulation protein YqfD [Thermoanaerobacteraceae bacterium]
MLIRKLWAYFWGYVVILVEGRWLERFLNLALTRNILFWDVAYKGKNRLLMKVTVNGFIPLRHVARKTGSRMRIQSKHGLPFLWMKVKKRKMLAAGLIFFVVAIYFFSSFVWFVELVPKEELKYLTEERIMEEICALGLRPGVPRWNVDLRTMEKELAVRLPELSWVGITLQGTKAQVEVVEKTLPPDDKDEKTPAHVVAAKDGIIDEILVIAGEGRVEEGDAVTAGQVLISGIIYPRQAEDTDQDRQQEQETRLQQPRYVHAEGVVKARVWYQAVGEADIVERGRRRTGARVHRISIKLGNKEIIIRGPKNSPYEYYEVVRQVKNLPQWRNFRLPVEVITSTYHEVEKYRVNRGVKGAEQLAVRRASEKIKKQLPAEAKVLSKRVERLDEGSKRTVKMRVIYEIQEDIGKTMLLQE